jgi:hypothetical protein
MGKELSQWSIWHRVFLLYSMVFFSWRPIKLSWATFFDGFATLLWFCYWVFNPRYFYGFNNCSLWSIIVEITLGKCAAPNAGRQWNHHLHSWTSVALNMCELNTT